MQHFTAVSSVLAWLQGLGAQRLVTDSRQVRAGDVFIAWPGAAHDGRAYVPAALAAGAVGALIEQQGLADFLQSQPGCTWAQAGSSVATIEGLKFSLGEIADAYHSQPSKHLQMLAVTGTNGKTSCSWWLAQVLSQLGQRCGVIGTLGVGEPGQVRSTGLTTPDPVTLHATLKDWLEQGFKACAMEASSIGIAEHRLDALHIDVAIFTNFTQDHLDYHTDMAAYWAEKRKLFGWSTLRAAVINVDDPQGQVLHQALRTQGLRVLTYALHDQTADITAQRLQNTPQGLSFDVQMQNQVWGVKTAVVGDYNVLNVLAVMCAAHALGHDWGDVIAAVGRLQAVPGRLQVVPFEKTPQPPFMVLVDYAHTPDALDNVLKALQARAQATHGRLWCVFGCGGNRDPIKRPLMGAIAARQADQVLITSDNPRSEDPHEIVAQVFAGVPEDIRHKVQVVVDRAQAIALAMREAQAGDVVVLAGKGHEDHQEIAGVKHPFSDVLCAQEAWYA